MKNKKLIVLTVLAGIVWAMIGYRIYDYLTSVPEVSQIEYKRVSSKMNNQNYSLTLDYRDPFLTKPSRFIFGETSNKRPDTKQIKLVQKNIDPINWTIISYIGQVKNASRDNYTAILRINGTEFFVKENEVISEFKILQIFSDSLKIVNTDQVRYIKRQRN